MKIKMHVDKMFTALGIELSTFDLVIANSKFGIIIWNEDPDEKLKSDIASAAIFETPIILVVRVGDTVPDVVMEGLNVIETIDYDENDLIKFKRDVDAAISKHMKPRDNVALIINAGK